MTRRRYPVDPGLPIYGSWMITGAGARRNDCVGYAPCLDAAARSPGPACCPRVCLRYEPIDRTRERDHEALRRSQVLP